MISTAPSDLISKVDNCYIQRLIVFEQDLTVNFLLNNLLGVQKSDILHNRKFTAFGWRVGVVKVFYSAYGDSILDEHRSKKNNAVL
jgi:hypothetical protein